MLLWRWRYSTVCATLYLVLSVNICYWHCVYCVYCWFNCGPSQRQASGTNPQMLARRQGHHWVWGLTQRRAYKEETIAINRNWVYNQICFLSHDIHVHDIKLFCNVWLSFNWFVSHMYNAATGWPILKHKQILAFHTHVLKKKLFVMVLTSVCKSINFLFGITPTVVIRLSWI